jgi:hypothetical protein
MDSSDNIDGVDNNAAAVADADADDHLTSRSVLASLKVWSSLVGDDAEADDDADDIDK